ncbi:hypothetical protein V2S04_11220 [Microbacterium sp. OR21]|uniref:hypothetical protein n=1 Tax=Microbacterium sp. OR21 TaxID=3095346 RepID=UPI0039B5E186
MNQWQFLAALAVPLFGLLGALGQRERTPAQLRRLREASAALKDVPAESDAYNALSELVAVQARAIMVRESRRLNVTNLVLTLILAAFAGSATYGLSVWCISVWGTGWAWVALPVSVLIALALMLVVGAAFGTIYNPPKGDQGFEDEAI